jgi:hypothetical protein
MPATHKMFMHQAEKQRNCLRFGAPTIVWTPNLHVILRQVAFMAFWIMAHFSPFKGKGRLAEAL